MCNGKMPLYMRVLESEKSFLFLLSCLGLVHQDMTELLPTYILI